MTRRLLFVLGLLLVGQGRAWAEECPGGTWLRKIGTVVTANDTTNTDGLQTAGGDTLSSTGHDVRAIRVTCGGTACAATVYDSDGASGTTTAAYVVDEPGAPASESRWYAYDPPLRFAEGVWFNDDGNVAAVIAYECR